MMFLHVRHVLMTFPRWIRIRASLPGVLMVPHFLQMTFFCSLVKGTL